MQYTNVCIIFLAVFTKKKGKRCPDQLCSVDEGSWTLEFPDNVFKEQ